MPTSQELRFYGLRAGNIAHKGLDYSICLSVVKDPVVTDCRHVFCWECLLRWMSEHTSCPTCRYDLRRARDRQRNESAGQTAQTDRSRTPYFRASGTLELGAFGASLAVPPVVNTQSSQYVTFTELQGQGVTAAQPWTQSSTRQRSQGHIARSAATDFHQVLTRAHSANHQHDPSHTIQARDRHENHINDQLAGRGGQHGSESEHPVSTPRGLSVPTSNMVAERSFAVTINLRMMRLMGIRADEMAHTSGMRYYPEYMEAARVVCMHWMAFLDRRCGLNMLSDDLMKLLAEELDAALAEACIVDFDRGERVPKALKRHFREVAQSTLNEL